MVKISVVSVESSSLNPGYTMPVTQRLVNSSECLAGCMAIEDQHWGWLVQCQFAVTEGDGKRIDCNFLRWQH